MKNAGFWATGNAIRQPAESWTPTMRHVAIVLAWHIGPDLTCDPSDAHLARLTGRSPATVERAVRDLEAAGVIRRETGAFRGGGRKRVIRWMFSPLVPLRLVVDNPDPEAVRTLTDEGSEPSPMRVRRTLMGEG